MKVFFWRTPVWEPLLYLLFVCLLFHIDYFQLTDWETTNRKTLFWNFVTVDFTQLIALSYLYGSKIANKISESLDWKVYKIFLYYNFKSFPLIYAGTIVKQSNCFCLTIYIKKTPFFSIPCYNN